MIGWRGASRYYSEEYQAAFELECKAFKKARDDMGLTNIKAMVPFCAITRPQSPWHHAKEWPKAWS